MKRFSKDLAYRIEAMESSRLISYKHHIPWADSIIAEVDNPPEWILNLSSLKYIGDVQKMLREFVFSEPFERVDKTKYYHDYLASLLLRYRRGELSWASFLDELGRFTDCSDGGEHSCEYFFMMLNDFEDSDFSSDLEESQHSRITAEYQSAVDDLLPTYKEFRRFYPRQKEPNK